MAVKGPRPPESWHLAVVRARETYAELTGDTGPYSAEAAGVILRLAVALWADTAAALEE